MHEIDTLQELLTKLPGIGPRQARRFAYFFMQAPQEYIQSTIDSIAELRSKKFLCAQCNRIFFISYTHNKSDICNICDDSTRDSTKILLVAKQADFENINQSRIWDGHYFILNRIVRLADKDPASSLPIALLKKRLSGGGITEIVIGLPVNPEGEHTRDCILNEIQDMTKQTIKVSELGRGLSVGSELEYSDHETIAAALKNRS